MIVSKVCVLVFATAGLVFASPAGADNYLDAAEEDYADQWWPAICSTIDSNRANGVFGVARGIISDGFTTDSAVDIINYAVASYCPRNWPLLTNMGRAASGA